MTWVFAWLAIIVWLLVAWFRVVELAPPKQSHWPNDTKGVIAFVFGWIGRSIKGTCPV